MIPGLVSRGWCSAECDLKKKEKEKEPLDWALFREAYEDYKAKYGEPPGALIANPWDVQNMIDNGAWVGPNGLIEFKGIPVMRDTNCPAGYCVGMAV